MSKTKLVSEGASLLVGAALSFGVAVYLGAWSGVLVYVYRLVAG